MKIQLDLDDKMKTTSETVSNLRIVLVDGPISYRSFYDNRLLSDLTLNCEEVSK